MSFERLKKNVSWGINEVYLFGSKVKNEFAKILPTELGTT